MEISKLLCLTLYLLVSKQWMHNYNYTVENFELYLILPVSFNTTFFLTEIQDGGAACTTYGVHIISKNKIRVFNIGYDRNTGAVQKINSPDYTGFILFLGF